MDPMSLSVTGVKELNRQFAAIEKGVQDKIAKPALRKGLNVVAKRAKAELWWSEHLRGLIGARVSKRKADGEAIGKVYMMPSPDRTINLNGREVGFEVVANIFEFGSVKQNIRPRPFMRSAAAHSKGQALAAIELEARKRVARIKAL